jgi:hypothetical protein
MLTGPFDDFDTAADALSFSNNEIRNNVAVAPAGKLTGAKEDDPTFFFRQLDRFFKQDLGRERVDDLYAFLMTCYVFVAQAPEPAIATARQ